MLTVPPKAGPKVSSFNQEEGVWSENQSTSLTVNSRAGPPLTAPCSPTVFFFNVLVLKDNSDPLLAI